MKKEIPELEIIDLDQDDIEISEMGLDELEEMKEEFEEIEEIEDELGETEEIEEEFEGARKGPQKKGVHVNMHIILLATGIIFLSLIVYRIVTWGKFISQEEIFSDGLGTYEDTLDYIVPLLDSNGNMVPLDTSDGLTIVTFGNAPFADDRDSEYNLATLIAERTGATVYNCSIGESSLAAETIPFDPVNSPMDAYTFYWLTVFAFGYNNSYYKTAAEVLGENIPSEATEVIETLQSIDFNTVDAIIVMYDATDYLMGHPVSNAEYIEDPRCFTGNLRAGIETIQSAYPHIRTIVLSPSYAYAIDENGQYISSDIQQYGDDVLSTYIIREYDTCYSMNITFIDNLYSHITEDNASEYLSDNLHLNQAGRELIADRAAEALFYFGW